ncbi:MAG: Fe-S cluster assembly sulfur transfer protein SufU [Gemmatimonadota bacterium]
MTELSTLYQDVILEHNRSPRNFRRMEDADRHAEGRNPLCGDQITVWLKLDGDLITDVSFHGSGCAISKASASLMTGAVKGKTRAEVDRLFDRFRGVVTGQGGDAQGGELGKLAVFSGISAFPMRVKCATLPWHALKAALERAEQVSTE